MAWRLEYSLAPISSAFASSFMPSFRVLSGFLLRAALFATPLLLAALWLEAGLRRMPNSYSVKQAGMEGCAGRIEVLILGPSEAAQGVDPAALGLPAYNLANVGQDPDYDARLYHAWSGRLPKLRFIIEGLSYPSLQTRLSRGDEAWRAFFYRRWMGLDHQDRSLDWSAQNFSVLLLIEPIPSLQAAWRGFVPSGSMPDTLGFQANPVTPEEDTDLRINSYTARKRAVTHQSEMFDEVQVLDEAALRGMAEDARQHGVQVLWVSPPVSRAYAAALDQVRRKALRERAAVLARECGVAWRDDADDRRFNDSDFFDVDHLNSRGAAKYSALLAKILASMESHPGGK
jgi:hypothetical protein